jgi:hypothetical protein
VPRLRWFTIAIVLSAAMGIATQAMTVGLAPTRIAVSLGLHGVLLGAAWQGHRWPWFVAGLFEAVALVSEVAVWDRRTWLVIGDGLSAYALVRGYFTDREPAPERQQ